MNNTKLFIIKNDKNLLFSFEEKSFEIKDYIGNDIIYSPIFSGFRVDILENNAKVNDLEVEYNKEMNISGNEIIIYNNIEYKEYVFNKNIIIGSDDRCEIIMDISDPILISFEDSNSIHSKFPIFLNGKIIIGKAKISEGDYICIGNELIFIGDGTIRLRGEVECHLMEDYQAFSKVNHQSYHRSPRLYYVSNSDPIKIDKPPTKPQKNKTTLVKLIIPPFIMLCITISISILIGRGLFIVISITATLMSMIKSIVSFFSERKENKEALLLREKKYQEYLVKKSIEINLRIQEEIEASDYQILKPYDLIELVNNDSRRIYEKSINDADFLEIRIGKQTRKPSFKIDLPEQRLNEDEDELHDEAKKIKDSFSELVDIGLTIDLKASNLGIIGTKELGILIVEQILLEIMTLHSYHEVQLLTIFDKEHLDSLEWISYSNNSRISAINVRGLIYNEVLRDQILGSFLQILKDREQKYKEDNNVRFSPTYVVSVLSSDLIAEHPVNEFLNRDIRHLGVHIIVVESEIESLRENIKTVIEIYSRQRSKLLIRDGVYIRKNFEIDELPSKETLLNHSRMLKGYNHIVGSEGGLPKMVTFLEMYDVDKVDELDINNRWTTNDSTKSLAVRLGMTDDDYIELNLHEKAHGPHGLVAGTTGSGKSEIIQSYILSLAINFHPHEVAFLLIDYKGGGMANMFANLPHLIGTITNLDKDGAMRALVSIKAELLRRQAIFAKYNVNHIKQYIRLFKNSEADEPMPHLFLISDEFAELKSEQPEFMSELVSTARIGRSLGIHLILATQKPSGVVDSQIWSNAKFKLCLKVQDAADSKEMLKTADAANIVEPGRAYLQVGNNEIYELFQSAWSGADYFGEKQENKIDKRIYMVNRLGQHKLLTKDLSGLNDNKIEKTTTELEEVINEVANVFAHTKQSKVSPIWVKELEKRYYLDDYVKIDHSCSESKITLGVVDAPSQQTQKMFESTLEKLGNIAIVGSSGNGKSYTLMTTLFSIFSRSSAEEAYSYLLDFGNNSLITLRNLPHVAEYITVEDTEKLVKFSSIVLDLISERKKILASAGANHISLYNKMNENKLSNVLIVVDNYDVVKDEFFDLHEMFVKISRDCSSLGIYLIFTGQNSNSFRTTLSNNLKTKIALAGLDKMSYSSVIGKGDFLPKDEPGSALVKWEGLVNVMQIMLPAKGNDDVEMVNAISDKVKYINDNYDGKRAKGIMVVNEDTSVDDVLNNVELLEHECTIGLDYETVQPYKYNLKSIPLLAIMSATGKGKTNLIKLILSQNIKDTVILDTVNNDLEIYKDKYEYYSSTKFEEFIHAIENGELNNKIIVVDDGDDFFANLTVITSKMIAELIVKNQINLVIAYNAVSIRRFSHDLARYIKGNTNNIIQLNPGDQSIVQFDYKMKKEKLKNGDVIVSDGGTVKKIRVPIIGEKNESIN